MSSARSASLPTESPSSRSPNEFHGVLGVSVSLEGQIDEVSSTSGQRERRRQGVLNGKVGQMVFDGLVQVASKGKAVVKARPAWRIAMNPFPSTTWTSHGASFTALSAACTWDNRR